jgi:hypothetical protein
MCQRGTLRANDDRGAFINKLEQFGHIRVAHANAAVAIGRANFVLVLRAVDVDESVVRVRVVLFGSIEPKNARHDEIFSGRKRIIRS